MATTNVTPPLAAQLEEFVFHPNPFTSEDVPRGLPRAGVADFLEQRIDAATPLRALRQAEKVLEFYDLAEVCGHFQSLLRRQEKTADDILRAIVIDRSVALACTPDRLDFAREYYTHLVGLASTSGEFQELVWLNDAVADNRESARLRARIEQVRVSGDAADYQAKLESNKLDEIESLRLTRSEKANTIKDQVLAIADRPRRIAEEIKMYLTVEYGYLEFLQPWAARRLRRETWAEQPAAQRSFQEDSRLRTELAEAFYRTANELDRFPHVLADNRPSLRVRCLRASAFFGRVLPPGDLLFLRANAGRQFDILSNQ